MAALLSVTAHRGDYSMHTQRVEQSQSPYHRCRDEEYWTVSNGVPVQLPWGVMSHRQKELQIEAERRADYEANFNPCGLE